MVKAILNFLLGCLVGGFFVYHPINKSTEARWEQCKIKMDICNLEFEESMTAWCNNHQKDIK